MANNERPMIMNDSRAMVDGRPVNDFSKLPQRTDPRLPHDVYSKDLVGEGKPVVVAGKSQPVVSGKGKQKYRIKPYTLKPRQPNPYADIMPESAFDKLPQRQAYRWAPYGSRVPGSNHRRPQNHKASGPVGPAICIKTSRPSGHPNSPRFKVYSPEGGCGLDGSHLADPPALALPAAALPAPAPKQCCQHCQSVRKGPRRWTKMTYGDAFDEKRRDP